MALDLGLGRIGRGSAPRSTAPAQAKATRREQRQKPGAGQEDDRPHRAFAAWMILSSLASADVRRLAQASEGIGLDVGQVGHAAHGPPGV